MIQNLRPTIRKAYPNIKPYCIFTSVPYFHYIEAATYVFCNTLSACEQPDIETMQIFSSGEEASCEAMVPACAATPAISLLLLALSKTPQDFTELMCPSGTMPPVELPMSSLRAHCVPGAQLEATMPSFDADCKGLVTWETPMLPASLELPPLPGFAGGQRSPSTGPRKTFLDMTTDALRNVSALYPACSEAEAALLKWTCAVEYPMCDYADGFITYANVSATDCDTLFSQAGAIRECADSIPPLDPHGVVLKALASILPIVGPAYCAGFNDTSAQQKKGDASPGPSGGAGGPPSPATAASPGDANSSGDAGSVRWGVITLVVVVVVVAGVAAVAVLVRRRRRQRLWRSGGAFSASIDVDEPF